jgi:membrane-bound lytic murein transglycosylase D
MANIVADPERYGLKLESIPDSPYFMRVDTDSQIDLGVVARLTDLPVAELYRINPGYSRWVTDPDGPHALLVPADKKDILLEGLSNLPEDERVQWARHEVKRGETLGQIAKRYQVTPEAIRSANRLAGNVLRLGHDLLIPASTSLAQVNPAPEPAAASASRGLVRVVHRVRSGETLWSIARKYNVYVHQLKQWNTLGDGILKLGQQLDVWTRSAATAAALAHHPPG